MSASFKKVAVLGAGVMGSGIAAHLANAGIPSLLLDIVPPGGLTDEDKKKGMTETSKAFRNRFSAGGKEKAVKASPAAFFTPVDAALISVGNFEDDLHKIHDCDWVVEVVKEDLAVKRDLFTRVLKHLQPHAIISSNTSGLRIVDMMKGFPEDVQQRFLVTHFFNPVRYMNLLELIPGERTSKEVLERLTRFGSDVLGKGVVMGKDTPNFIGNRIGIFGIMETIRVMMADDYNIDEVDAVFGTAMGRAKSAVFRTADVVGLDTFVHVAQNCFENLPNDEMKDVFKVPDFIKEMVKRGWLGNKTKQGFYKKEGSEILTLDWKTLEYKAKAKVRSEALGQVKDLDDAGEKQRILCNADDRLGRLAWKVTSSTLAYSARRLGEIADDIVNIDRAMRWGFNWEQGPFEGWDALGVKGTVERMDRDGTKIPALVRDMLSSGRQSFYESHGGTRTYYDFTSKQARPVDEGKKTLRLAPFKEQKKIVKENLGASLIDIGDGILNLEFHTKMNSIDADIGQLMLDAVEIAEKDWLGLVITNEGTNFSVGANLLLVYMEAQSGNWENLDKMVREFQNANKRLRYSRVPVVAAPFQMTFGGGAEIESLLRKSFETVAMAKVATSAEEARRLGFLRPADGITLNRDQLMYAAKEQALGLARAGYRAPRPRTARLPGPSAAATFGMALRSMRDGHMISDHDLLISEKIASVMTGGNTSPRVLLTEEKLLDLEREGFLSLLGTAKSQERISYMLMNNKPLRN